MNHFGESLLLVSALVQVACGVFPNSQNMANVLFRPQLASLDATNSMACFSNYMVESSESNKAFSQDYSECLLSAKAGRQAAETEMVNKRDAIENSSQDICQRLHTCNSLNASLEFFDCHAKNGANSTKGVYSISGNASEHANVLQEKYRILDFRHEQCCNTAERKYVESTTNNYRNLQDCLDDRKRPSQPAIATTQLTSSATTELVSSTTDKQPSFEISDATTSEAPEVIELQ